VIDPLILVRGIHLAATLLAAGTVSFSALVAEPALIGVDAAALRGRLKLISWLALAVAIPSGAAWLVLLAAQILGESPMQACLNGGVWSVTTFTQFGEVWTVRLVLACLLAIVIGFHRLRWLTLAVAIALTALIAYSGHAAGTPGTAGGVHLASDMLHLTAAGAWLGALPALVLLLTAAAAGGEMWQAAAVRAVRRFSTLGIAAVATLIVTGAINSWNLLDGPRDLIATGYGKLLLAKLGLFGIMLVFAAVNRVRLTPRLPQRAAMTALVRNTMAEIVLGLGVLSIVAALGVTEPGAHAAHAGTAIPPDAAFVHIHTSEIMAEVTIEPGHPGRTQVSIRVMHEDGSEFPAKAVALALDPPNAQAPAKLRPAVRQSDGTWLVGEIELAAPGVWTARVIVDTGGKEPLVVDGPIVIER